MTENEAILIMDGATREEHLYMYDAEDRPYLVARAENMALNALKEIQAYRAIGTVEEIKSFFNENRKAGYKHGYADGYADAIDEFGKKIFYYCSMSNMNATMIRQIAEQMKGGAE